MPRAVAACLAAILLLTFASGVFACPFCAAVSPSLTDRLKGARFAVVARMVGSALSSDSSIREIEFAPVRFLQGDERALGVQSFMAPIPQQPDATLSYFVIGALEADVAGRDRVVWSLPTPVSEVAADYIVGLGDSPEPGPERVAYFIPFLNHADPLIARDAYNEFGAAPYEDVKAVAGQLPRAKLKEWIADETIPSNDRRLYLTLLGVCGELKDAESLVAMIQRSVNKEQQDAALDAMVACYLTLSGEAGLPTIDELILEADGVSLGNRQSAVLALRFHGEEETKIPRSALLESMRLLLKQPEAADLVIRDLARWEDWSVLEELVTLFDESSSDHKFLRVPIIKYLQACPLPHATTALRKIEQEHPQVVALASVFPFELGRRRSPDAARRLPDSIPSESADVGDHPLGEKTSGGEQQESDNGVEGINAAAEVGEQDIGDQSPSGRSQPDNANSANSQDSHSIFTNAFVGIMFVGLGILVVLTILLILRPW